MHYKPVLIQSDLDGFATGPASIPVASLGLGIAGGKNKEKKIGSNTAVETALILARGA